MNDAEHELEKGSGNGILWASAIVAVGMVLSAAAYAFVVRSSEEKSAESSAAVSSAPALTSLQEEVTPAEGVTLPVAWGNLGQQLTAAGVIDEAQFKALYARQGGLPQDMAQMLDGSDNGQIKMTPQNAGIILNMLWALGLGNRNPILTNGPMENPQYGGAGNFASTGGWTLAAGNAMNHYDMHQFVTLTAAQQSLVEQVAQGIYRPCCGNSAYFPDCNHGMAMLGLLELMASQGANADQMYKAALTVNSYWFPDTYMTLAEYFAGRGIVWSAVDPKTVLGAAYSSAQGYQQILSEETQPPSGQPSGGGSCSTS
jgi:hypothetical protein